MAKSINLLPDQVVETQKKSSRVHQTTSLSIVGLLVFALINLVILFFSLQITNRLDTANGTIASLTQEIEGLKNVEERLLFLREKTTFLGRINRTEVDFSKVWSTLQQASNGLAELDSIEINRNKELMLTASTVTLADAANFLVEMRKQPESEDFKILDITFTNKEDLERKLTFKAQFFLKSEADI